MGEMMRILWISRHSPLKAQIDALREVFGDVEIVQYDKHVRDADHVLELIAYYDAQEVVVVLPLSIIAHILQKGVKPLYMRMEVIHHPCEGPSKCTDFDPDRDYWDPGSKRHYRFVAIERIIKLEMVTEKLYP